MAAPVIDVHCHTFNAADLPVRGFIQHVEARGSPLGALLGRLADALVGSDAPGYEAEKAKLDMLLAGDQAVLQLVADIRPVSLSDQLAREVNEALVQLQGRDPGLVRELGVAVAAADAAAGGAPSAAEDLMAVDRLPDLIGMAKRAIAWIKIFGKYRLDVTGLMIESSHDAMDLYCAMLVDLGTGLGDVPRTTVRQQVELQEKISRLSMLGRLPTSSRARLHPFVGFDPRRELKARQVGDIERPLQVVKLAVTDYGCIGVKLYPPMGWRPIGNTATVGMTAEDAQLVDEILREFYEWCSSEQVPLTAHCNESNYADDAYKDFTSPENWIAVLTEFPELHLNLGHFGGARKAEPPDGWPWRIARAAEQFPYLYVDVGNQPVYEQDVMAAYLAMLEQMFADPATAPLKDRVMFGSDWYMVALHPDADRFLTEYQGLFEARFHSDAAAAFMGGTARRFLGFDDETNANAIRLLGRYKRFAPNDIPSWLAAAPDAGGTPG